MSSKGAKSNLKITVRERGKIVTRREGHNIWLNTGRAFLSQVMSYSSYAPDFFQQTKLPQYVGFGIGGYKQNSLPIANADPCLTHYPGTNNQLDIDASVTTLERPARITWAVGPNPPTGSIPHLSYDSGDVWLKQLSVATHPTIFSIAWTCSFSLTDYSDGPFLVVPLSEIGLFVAGNDPNVYNQQPIAYDTFDSIPKTANFSFDVSWTVRF